MYDIINFKAALHKLTALGSFLHPIINYKLMRSVSIFRLPREKNIQEQQIQKKVSKKSVQAFFQ